ncbi:Tellurite methyltransferase [Oligella sp. MSHR50489EDL]|uniref:tellurite resistance methyltransferase TehB n=1 Tax=Oligella sp. MSHR50489EDL TaxID=3139409 RepID=UPI003D8173D9
MPQSNSPSLSNLPANYFKDTYGLSLTHSELLAATPYFVGERALDIGSGRGRNAIYLAQHGFQVDAFDVNPQAIQILDHIIEKEGIKSIHTSIKDLNQDPSISGEYDILVCTVVMMFLKSETIPPLIAQMQAATKAGGLNIIVCAMDTEAYPAKSDLSFSFKAGELRNYYQGWEFLKYNEEVGELRRRNPDGSFVKQQFATMIAKKPF